MNPAPDRSFPRRERLKSKKRIARLFEQGKGGFVYPVRYVLLDDSAEESVAGKDRSLSVLIAVPKRHHKRAVERNLLKRRMREAYRLNKQALSGILSGPYALGLLYASGDGAGSLPIQRPVSKIIRIRREQARAASQRPPEICPGRARPERRTMPEPPAP